MIRSLVLAATLVLLYPLRPDRAKDGDTFVGVIEIRPGLYEQVTVRIDCYSAPEKSEDGGAEATARLVSFLAADGGSYQLRTNWKRDKYGRLLGEPLFGDAGYCASLGKQPCLGRGCP